MIQMGVYPTRTDAEIAQGALDAAGIRSVLESDDAGGAYPFSFNGGVRLLVEEDDAHAATDVLEGTSDQPDGPPDELEPGQALRSEFDRLTHHPLSEARRLDAEAALGEIGATPFISVARVVFVVALAFLVLLAIALTAYYVVR
jgi:hypothetical protein